jgi:hypothetical protein
VIYDENQSDDFVGVIAPDGRTVHWVDDDGQSVGTYTAPDTLEMCYVETGEDTEAVCAVMKRGS